MEKKKKSEREKSSRAGLMTPTPGHEKEGAGGWAVSWGSGPFSSLSLLGAPLPPTGEEQSGNQHPQCHGGLRWDSHSSHGLRGH